LRPVGVGGDTFIVIVILIVLGRRPAETKDGDYDYE
jgi:hypothetical protein